MLISLYSTYPRRQRRSGIRLALVLMGMGLGGVTCGGDPDIAD